MKYVYSQYFSGSAGTTVICFKEWSGKGKKVGTVCLYLFSQCCSQYKESTSLSDKGAIILERKVVLTMVKLIMHNGPFLSKENIVKIFW